MGVDRQLSDSVGVEGARPYGVTPGAIALGANARGAFEGAVPYISDTPFVQPFEDRPLCSGTTTKGAACKAKAEPGKERCTAHPEE